MKEFIDQVAGEVAELADAHERSTLAVTAAILATAFFVPNGRYMTRESALSHAVIVDARIRTLASGLLEVVGNNSGR